MSTTKQEMLSGWGRTPVASCTAWRPERGRDLKQIVTEPANADGHVIARGLGRSYGDASLQPSGTIHMERLNHFIHFDTEQGIVSAQGGVTLAELMELAIPQGWFPYNIPGSRHITIGGAFACNVHGKNHFRDGDFAEHVLAIRLMLATGESVECSPHQNSELFWATAGGMGMTGVIETITLQLKRVSSSSLSATTYRVESLDDMIAAFEHYRDGCEYMVGWIDHMAKGDMIGRGIFEAANHTQREEGGLPLSHFTPSKPAFNVPFFFPSFILNRYSMAIYNRRRFKKYSTWRQMETIDFNTFFHPLDRIGQWNRLYGKRGFYQYQCIFPESPDVVVRMKNFLSMLQKDKIFSFLAVIKYHRDGQGFLNFSKRGYSIALDFANTARVRRVLPKIDQWVAENGGRVYLAKDALLSPELFTFMYGDKASHWLDIIHDIDPHNRFTSLMSERLGWKKTS